MATYDATGSIFCPGETVQGFGLHNAGRYYTILAMRGNKLFLRPHLGGKDRWLGNRWFRVV